MTVRRLDKETGDIVTRGQQFVNEVYEVEQTIKTRLNLFLGEYFRNITDGTPWYEQILGKFASLNAAESALRARIANTPDVVRLTSFAAQYDINTRTYTVQAGVLTTFGEASVLLTNPFGPSDPAPIVPPDPQATQVVINELSVVV